MAFVSRNPKTILNPETADGCILLRPDNMAGSQEFIGFLKNVYVDSTYDKPNNCYVFKGRDDGKDYLIFGCKSMHEEMAPYVIGDLVSIKYNGTHINKGGKYAGKSSLVWKVLGESTWIPSTEFIQQLQQEVYNRRIEVQRQLATNPQGMSQPQGYAPQQQQNYGMAPQGYAPPLHPQMQQGHVNAAPVFVAPSSHQQHPSSYGSRPTDPFG